MDGFLRCTTEELMLMMRLCGYTAIAKEIGESSFGEKSDEAWETLYEGATHQLLLKGIWDVEKAARQEVPLHNELQSLMQQFAQTKHIIRSVHSKAEETLMFHHLPNKKWMMHHVVSNLIHEFFFVPEEEIHLHLVRFHNYDDLVGSDTMSFMLTDQQFELLSQEEKKKDVQKLARLNADDKQAFYALCEALVENNWSFNNTSLVNIDVDSNQTEVKEVLLHLRSEEGIWVVTIKNDDLVHLELKSTDEWLVPVKNIIH